MLKSRREISLRLSLFLNKREFKKHIFRKDKSESQYIGIGYHYMKIYICCK